MSGHSNTDGVTRVRPDGSVLVIHVVPSDLPRGAQTRAREVRRELDGHGSTHRVLSIFATPDPAGLADESLAVNVERRSMFVSPLALFRLRQYLVHHQPSAVIAYGSEALRYCALARPRTTRVVYSKTGVTAEDLHGLRLRALRWLVSRADHVAAVSSETADEAETLLAVPRHRITMVSNGRDPDTFSPGDVPGRGRTRLLWIGHLTATKRPDLFIDLVAELRSRGLDFEASLIGDGPELEQLRSRALAAGVELLGRRRDVDDVMRAADIFVFTGERDGEGLPGVLIEASLSALPIVTTDVPGARDVVVDGVTGVVLMSRTPLALADAVEMLLRDDHRRTEMGQNGRRRSQEVFTVASTAARWKSLLADLLATDA